MRGFMALSALLALAASPIPVSAQSDGFVWTFSQFQNSQGIDTAVLVFGLPETDAVQFTASCSAAPGGGVPRALISADVSRFKAGARATVRFMALGFDREIAGKIVKSTSGEGQDGVSLAIPTDSPLWQKFTEIRAINYSVRGMPPLRLPLDDIAPPLENFMRDCAEFAGSARAGAGGGGDTCKVMARVRSTNDGKAVKITFVNRTDEHRVLAWLDFDGNPIEYAQLEAGQSFTVETSSTHPWMVTDGPGNCIERFMPGPKAREIAITRASPGFGDE